MLFVGIALIHTHIVAADQRLYVQSATELLHCSLGVQDLQTPLGTLKELVEIVSKLATSAKHDKQGLIIITGL